MQLKRTVLGALAATACVAAPEAPAQSITGQVRIERVEVRPNPAYSDGRHPPQVEIAITVRRPQLQLNECQVELTINDNGPSLPPNLAFGPGDRTKSVRYVFGALEGDFTLLARGRGACAGSQQSVRVRVIDGAKAGAGKTAPATSGADAKPPACPPGWQVVPGYPQGPRISCAPRMPSSPMKCTGGTTYFEEGGQIGCR